MKRLSSFKWTILILALHLVATLYFAFSLPRETPVPIHWNIHNEIDGWASHGFGVWWGFGLNLLLFLMLILMPWYSPWFRKYRERFDRLLPGLTAVLAFFFGLLGVYALYVAKWGEFKGVNMILILMGFFILLLGNLLPKVPKNFFIGIKTPWTLANEEVWDKTHRLGGLLFVLGGLLMIVKGLILPELRWFQTGSAVLVFAMLLYPLVHSFILFKKLGKTE